MSSRLQRGDRLKQLREVRLNKNKSKRQAVRIQFLVEHVFQVETYFFCDRLQDDEDIYDEVDEEEAQQDEDFVVDDDNAGYIDDGNNEQYFSDEYEQEADQSKNGKNKKRE